MKSGAAVLAFAFLATSAFAAELVAPIEFVPKYSDRHDARPIVFASAESDSGDMPHSLSAKFEMHHRPGSRYGIEFSGCGGTFEVFLNDHSVCVLSAPPYQCDIMASVRVGENELVIETLDEFSFPPMAGDLVELKVAPRPTSVAEIMSVDRSAIRFKPPCVVTGVVAFAHSFINDTAVLVDERDPNGPGMYMSGAMPEVPKSVRVGYDRLRVGDRVEVVGVVDPLVVRQGVTAARITRIGEADLPPPPVTRMRDLAGGRRSNTRVRFVGRVGELKMIPAFESMVPELTLETDEGPLRVHGLSESAVQKYSGEMVYVDGVMMPYVSSSGVELAPVLEAIGDESIHPAPGWRRLVAVATTALRIAAIAASVPLLLAVLLLVFDRRQRKARAKAISSERRRIAAHLHDSVSQYLSGTRLLLDTVRMEESTLPAEQREALVTACQMLDISRLEVRNAIDNLRNDDILTMRLDELLALHARRLATARHLSVETGLEPMPSDLAPKVKGDVLAVVQEAVSNAVRHGRASRVRIEASRTDRGGFRVRVMNDGPAFDAEHAPGSDSGHFGLDNMRERGERSGFSVSFGSEGGWSFVNLEGGERR